MENEPQYKTKPVEIKCPLFNNKKFEVLDGCLDDILVLHDKYLECKWKSNIIEISEDGMRKEVKYQGNKRMMKDKIIDVGAAYINSLDLYEMTVHCTHEDDYTIRFKTFAEAMDVVNKITQWLIL